ncbi:hypothetical protein MHY87_15870 [Microvirga sp. ACRRW]|uniref:hypothetical protein n=1 Tax=Microvirga sp. ACRRW TaxID=2918205 RepID=UPI001EF45937|nr:hypothetical protein [Microvirga sp. ACRRW]MCG7394382.1 hypothetical protein [Microvirga sp. ACRRW]
MQVDVQHPRFEETAARDRVYSPDILPWIQSLLAILADIDVAYEQKIDAIERSTRDERLKREMIAGLRQRHRERRAFYLAELEAIQNQVRASFS